MGSQHHCGLPANKVDGGVPIHKKRHQPWWVQLQASHCTGCALPAAYCLHSPRRQPTRRPASPGGRQTPDVAAATQKVVDCGGQLVLDGACSGKSCPGRGYRHPWWHLGMAAVSTRGQSERPSNVPPSARVPSWACWCWPHGRQSHRTPPPLHKSATPAGEEQCTIQKNQPKDPAPTMYHGRQGPMGPGPSHLALARSPAWTPGVVTPSRLQRRCPRHGTPTPDAGEGP